MRQARTLTYQECALLLERIRDRPHPARNSLMLNLLHRAGLRVGELAALNISDVIGVDGRIRDQIALAPEQTKDIHLRQLMPHLSSPDFPLRRQKKSPLL